MTIISSESPGCGKKGNPVHSQYECKQVQTTVENSAEVPQKLKSVTTIQSSNPTSGSISRRNPHFHACSIIHTCQDMEATSMSTDGHMKEKWYLLHTMCMFIQPLGRRKSCHL